MLRTPTTISRSPEPSATRARQSFSEPGWSRTSRTRAATTPESPRHGQRTSSTLTPFAVSRSASSSAARSVGQTSRSQDRTTFTGACPPSSSDAAELLEEADVALVEQSDIRDAVHGHRRPVDAEAEREPRVALGVVPDVLQDDRMYHAGAEDLDPSVAPAPAPRPAADEARHVDLRARLHEGEVGGHEPDPLLGSEHRLREGLERSLQVREGQALVDGQA